MPPGPPLQRVRFKSAAGRFTDPTSQKLGKVLGPMPPDPTLLAISHVAAGQTNVTCGAAQNAPMPRGPRAALWPASTKMSTPSSATCRGISPATCAASSSTSAPLACASSTTRSMGITSPVTLEAPVMATSLTFPSPASSAFSKKSRSRGPPPVPSSEISSGGHTTCSIPRSHASLLTARERAWCSKPEVMTISPAANLRSLMATWRAPVQDVVSTRREGEGSPKNVAIVECASA
mmetsp:Transcript_31860/g.101498  ORF Transcript_31860/g.101498 Transcript_31860/m.101498 type:complete len:235 (-) Transcript_31860:158-862(-)